MRPEQFETNRGKAIIEGPAGTIQYYTDTFIKLGFIVESERQPDDTVQLRLKDEFGDIITDERSYEIALNKFSIDQGKYDQGSNQTPVITFDAEDRPYIKIKAVL